MTAERRRPPPRAGAEGPPRASAVLQAVLEEAKPRQPGMGDMMLGPFRRQGPRFRILILERSTGRMITWEPSDGTQAEAHGLLAVVQADLDRLEVPDFIRKWGRRRRRF